MRQLVTLIALGMCLSFSASAWAEEAEAAPSGGGRATKLLEGHRLFANNDFDAAERAYRRVVVDNDSDAQAHFLVGCAQRAGGNLPAALVSFQRAAELAGEENAALKARALMNVAWVQEARGELAEARTAWRAYIAFAEGHQDVPTYVANARHRLEVITGVEELDAAYAPVRQRIAERAASQSGN